MLAILLVFRSSAPPGHGAQVIGLFQEDVEKTFKQLIHVTWTEFIFGFRQRLLTLVFTNEVDNRLAYGNEIERASSELQAVLWGLEIVFGLLENRFEATTE